METVTHDGRETSYRLARPDGAGPTVLYVHGSGGSHRVWAHQYSPAGPAHPAVALDLSGHGDSDDVEASPGPETLAAYADDVCAVASETGADVLVGNSLGGAVVFETVLERSLDVSGIVFAGSGARLAVHESVREMLTADFEAAVEFLHGENRLFHRSDPDLHERSKAQMRDTGQAVTRRDFLTCHTFDVRERLDDLTVPTRAVVGEYDSLTPPSYHEYLAEEMPNCDCVVLEDSAHLAMLERPERFNEAVADFFFSDDLKSHSYN